MKIKVAKRDLTSALRVVSHTVSNENNISGHYLFRPVNEHTAEILAYNGRIFSSCPFVAEFGEGEAAPFTIANSRLQGLMDSMRDDGVLEIESHGSSVLVNVGGRRTLSLSSLDPDLFPFWDDTFKKAEMTATLSAERLNNALTHSKAFIYADEVKAPQLCVTEIRGGHLYSTDLMAVSVVKMEGLDKASFRIFGADVKSVTAFLSTFKPTKVEKPETEGKKPEKSEKEPEVLVEIWESDKALFLRRKDGAIFGESKFEKRFPDLSVDWTTTDDFWVDLAKDEVASGTKFLHAGAKEGDNVIRFDLRDGKVVFSMASETGKVNTFIVPVIAQGQVESPTPLPDGGFPVNNTYLVSLLDACEGSKVRFGIAKRPKGGWIRVQDPRGPDTFLTTVGWLKLA